MPTRVSPSELICASIDELLDDADLDRGEGLGEVARFDRAAGVPVHVGARGHRVRRPGALRSRVVRLRGLPQWLQ